jgi:hypothetical protein
MNSKYIFTAIFVVGFIVGWNAFLIQRDQKIFDSYDKAIKYDHPKVEELNRK